MSSPAPVHPLPLFRCNTSGSARRTGLGLLAGALLCLVAGVSPAQAESSFWASVSTPSAGPSTSIGRPALGCQSGAIALPLHHHGYQVLRPQRNRFYGQPDLIAFITGLADRMAPLGHGDILVGDMSQPRGGPMPSGHASHQSGRDVDLWLRFARMPLTEAELAAPKPVVMVRSGAHLVDPKVWGTAQEDLIRLAAQSPNVERIFVNPAIKASLCSRFGDQTAWLRVIRPWFGHDEHIHVRLACPAGDSQCVDQPPPPPGSGCGAEVQSWFAPPPPSSAHKAKAKPRPKQLPAACRAVARAPAAMPVIPAKATDPVRPSGQ